MMQRRPRSRSVHRSAAILLAALVCLLVVVVIGTLLMQTVLRQQRQLLHAQEQVQVFWLAESAVQRAVTRLTAAADYGGETWQAAGRSARGPWTGVAVIRVETAPGDPARRRVVVEARCGDEPSRRVAQRRQVVVLLPAQGASS
jgi:Tfp pilus assembly protein PilX